MATLFDTCALGNLELRNRFVRSATWEGFAPDSGEVTDDLIAMYRKLAQGQVGLIITGLAGVETHLRGEGGLSNQRLVELIDGSDLEEDLKQELQVLRKYRNKWVHVAEPWDDDALLASPEKHESELEGMARRCAVALAR